MRWLAATLFSSLAIAEAHGQSPSSTLKGLDECFAQTRKAEAACDQAGYDTAARLGCRLKAHSEEKRCLDSLFSNREEAAPANPSTRAPPAAAIPAPPEGTPAPPPAALASPTAGPVSPPAASASPPMTPKSSPVPAQGVWDDNSAALPANGWLVSETVSPRDFSPLFVAKLYALPPVAPDGPETLILRCRNLQTEISLGGSKAWRALRGREVEVVISPDQPAAKPMRWRLSVDGRSAVAPENSVDLLRGLEGGRMAISVTDGTGRAVAATFDLTGIEAVRARLAKACHWPNATVESRGR